MNKAITSVDKSIGLSGARILIVDDHRNIRLSLKMILEGEGAIVSEAESLAAARSSLNFKGPKSATTFEPISFDLVLLDIRLPDGSGIDILNELKARSLARKVIIITGEGTSAEAYRATQLGAFDYIEKPFTPERVLVSLRRAYEFDKLSSNPASNNWEMIGRHPKVIELQELIQRVGPTSGRVLITGESGTGKELVARALHKLSSRADKVMLKVNCAAIPHGLMESELFGHEKGAFTGAVKQRQGVFERADGGTLFLDEIGELEIDVQAKLLRVLQNGEFQRVGGEKVLTSDLRLIAATNKDLKASVSKGEFREDLFYRLNVVSINTAPLRDRASDIPLLAETFLKQALEEHALGEKMLSDAAMKQLIAYNWPGNVRELRNTLERAAILSDASVIEHFEDLENSKTLKSSSPFPLTSTSTPPTSPSASDGASEQDRLKIEVSTMSWEDFHEFSDREFLRFILKQTKGNVSEASRVLQLERAYLHRLLKKLGIQRDVQFE
jgi:two-component system nitrogen regulation response regulator NtrX